MIPFKTRPRGSIPRAIPVVHGGALLVLAAALLSLVATDRVLAEGDGAPPGADPRLLWRSPEKPMIDPAGVEPSVDHILADIKALSAFPTRYAASRNSPDLRRWLSRRIASLGLELEELPFSLNAGGIETRQANLQVRLAGGNPAAPGLLLLAHYDSVNEGWEGETSSLEDPESPAPGADDNASGVAILLECLRLLQERPLPRDVLFLFTAAEEMGQAGCRAWCESHLDREGPVAWALNIDQAGKSRGPMRGLRVFTRGPGAGLALHLRELGAALTPEILAWRLDLDDTLAKSDHGPLLDRQVAAVSLAEGAGYYPWEHQGEGDLPEHLDPGMLAAVARLVMAIAVDPDLPPPSPARPRAGRR